MGALDDALRRQSARATGCARVASFDHPDFGKLGNERARPYFVPVFATRNRTVARAYGVWPVPRTAPSAAVRPPVDLLIEKTDMFAEPELATNR